MKWVKVEDGMPGNFEEVLIWVVYEDGQVECLMSWFNSEKWMRRYRKSIADFKVTHWMRIEEPNG